MSGTGHKRMKRLRIVLKNTVFILFVDVFRIKWNTLWDPRGNLPGMNGVRFFLIGCLAVLLVAAGCT
ncbi:MAG TPA: hypothetical protein VK450_05960, partial [Methanomicrobiales archaeon]|nr:hypothetical protein [Methanomicrobiales archaeon]